MWLEGFEPPTTPAWFLTRIYDAMQECSTRLSYSHPLYINPFVAHLYEDEQLYIVKIKDSLCYRHFEFIGIILHYFTWVQRVFNFSKIYPSISSASSLPSLSVMHVHSVRHASYFGSNILTSYFGLDLLISLPTLNLSTIDTFIPFTLNSLTTYFLLL